MFAFSSITAFFVYYFEFIVLQLYRAFAIFLPRNIVGDETSLPQVFTSVYGYTALAVFVGFALTAGFIANLIVWHPEKVRLAGWIQFIFTLRKDPADPDGPEFLDFFSSIAAAALTIAFLLIMGIIIAVVWPIIVVSPGFYLLYYALNKLALKFALEEDPLPSMEGIPVLQFVFWFINLVLTLVFQTVFNIGRGGKGRLASVPSAGGKKRKQKGKLGVAAGKGEAE